MSLLPSAVPRVSFKVIKSSFITSDVLRTMTQKNAKYLVRAAALTRQVVRRSMKPGGKKRIRSKPGEPPRSQRNPLLRKMFFFWLAQDRESIVVGPAALYRNGAVPDVLEFGGAPDAGWSRGVVQAPRPYMRPGLEVAEEQFPAIWRSI